ncbi:MAG: mechanosensitive ion channel [Acidobacteriaceae bacterium]|nr:mechanosensitive ion channel [Acidobacteriaceae bacterium]
MGNTILSAIPKIAVGFLLVVVGVIAAKLIEIVLRTLLVRVRFDGLMEKTGIDKALQRIGLRKQLNVFIPKLVYFLVLFLLAKTASDALGLIAISNAIGAFFSYLPNVVAALLLLILGTTLGQFAGETVTQAAENSGIESAVVLGKLASSLIVFVVAMMAIAQLKIDTEMVRIVTSFFLGAGALAFGLAFGLGSRDIVQNIMVGFYARKMLAVGKDLEIAGQRGTLTAITATHVILDNEGKNIVIANSNLLEAAYKSSHE